MQMAKFSAIEWTSMYARCFSKCICDGDNSKWNRHRFLLKMNRFSCSKTLILFIKFDFYVKIYL